MKGSTLLLLCAVALTHGVELKLKKNGEKCNCNPGEAWQICDANWDKDDVLVAHPYCDKFYKCSNGRPVTFDCAPGLLYNPYIEDCDWPQNVDCGDRPISDGQEIDEDDCDEDDDVNGGVDKSEEDGGQVDGGDNGQGGGGEGGDGGNGGNGGDGNNGADGEDCEDNGTDNGGSDNGGNDNTPVGGGHDDPSQAPAICAAEGSEDVLVAHENCNKFYICTGGKPVPMRCPNNLLFNPFTDQCDWPGKVDCGDRVIPDPEDNDNGDNDGGSDNGGSDNGDADNDGSDNDGSDNGDTDSGDSDNGDSDNGGSDNGGSDNGDSDNGGGGTCNCNPGEAQEICAADGSDGVMIAHENCNQYYKCDHGSPAVFTCFGTLLYNPYTEKCDWPENVECGDRIILEPEDDDNEGADNGGSDNGGSDNGGSDNGDSDNGGSDNGGSDNDGSEDSPVGGGNCDPSEAPTICAADDSEGVLVAHENCNQFYICNGGKPVALTCPKDLLFNPNTDQCDWPYNVDCGDRVIPDPDDSDNGDSDNGGSDNDGSDNGGSDNGGSDNGGSDNGGSDNGGSDNGDNGGTCNCNPDEAPEICAADGSEGGLIAHENCNQFYMCAHGKPVAFRCYGNLLYNPHTERCDWPENVDCGDRVIPDPEDEDNGGSDNGGSDNGGSDNGGSDNGGSDNGGSENGPVGGGNCDPSEAPTICAADESEGVLVAHENCNQFYICNGGKPVALTCPNNLLFNPNTDQCDWAYNVDCGDRIIPDPEDNANGGSDNGGSDNGGSDNGGSDNGGSENGGSDNGESENGPIGGGNCDPSEAPAICAADNSEGVLVAHENCNQFYICNGGKPVVLTCPNNLLFNPNTDQCDWPYNVDCGDRVIPDPDDNDNGDSASGGSDNDGSDNGGSDNGGSDNGGSDNGGSDNGGSDNGGSEIGPVGGGNCDPSEAPAICAANDSEGVLIAHENCNQFYICNGGKPVALTCPNNLLFNPNTDQCDWPENVECGDRVIPEPEDDNNGDSDNGGSDNGGSDNGGSDNGGSDNGGSDNDGSDSGGSDNDGSDNGGSDNGGSNSEESDNGESDNGPVGGGNCDPSEAPAICAADNSEGVLVAHENCNQFYICNGGKPVALTCPNNLLFNPHTDQCDWPENVECGDRVIPDPEDNENGGSDNGGSDNGGSDNGGSGNGESDNDGSDNGSGGTCNCNPGEAPEICAADGSEGVLIAHENCDQFYKCASGLPVVLKCYGGLLYNPYTERCDWPQNVECGDRVIPDPEDNDNGTGDNGGSDNDGSDNGGSDNGGSDNDGSDNGSGGPCNCNPEEAPEICAADESEGVLIAHENCDQFYKCASGVPVALNCYGGLLYNPYTQTCDWPQNVECGDRVIPAPEDNDNGNGDNDGSDNDGSDNDGSDNGGSDNDGSDNDGSDNGDSDNDGSDNGESDNGGSGIDDPSQAPSICAGSGSDGTLVAHENCNQYFMCSGGLPVAMSCAGDLLFNVNTQQCDWPRLVDCGGRIEPETDDCFCNPRQAPAICVGANTEGVMIAHEICDQFYVCAGGVPVARSCPAGLNYNPRKEVCDWPMNVDCDTRVSRFNSVNKHLESRQTLRK